MPYNSMGIWRNNSNSIQYSKEFQKELQLFSKKV